MTRIDVAINTILNKPIKEINIQEAKKKLRACGILDKNDNIRPAYREILITKNKKNGFKLS